MTPAPIPPGDDPRPPRHRIDARVERVAENSYHVTSGPDVHEAMRDILDLLYIEDHDATDDELYEAFLSKAYAGCTLCQAGFIARAVLEGRQYPALPDYFRRSLVSRAPSTGETE